MHEFNPNLIDSSQIPSGVEAMKSSEDLKSFSHAAGQLLQSAEVLPQVDLADEGILAAVDRNYLPVAYDAASYSGRSGGYQLLRQNVERALKTVPGPAKHDLLEVIDSHSLHGRAIPESLGNWSLGDDEGKLAQFVGIYESNPTIAGDIVRNNIVGMHATASGALPGILRQGAILSAAEAGKRGEALMTGERTFSQKGGQASISFADWRGPETIKQFTEQGISGDLAKLEQDAVALQEALDAEVTLSEDHPYVHNSRRRLEDLRANIASIKTRPESVESQLILKNFPIAFGLSADGYNIYRTGKDIPEGEEGIAARGRFEDKGEFLVVAQEIPLEKTSMIFTPREHMAELASVLAAHGRNMIRVAPLEVITTKY